ncbi:MAG TPA: DUF1828 domain-containing protein [Candidatus Avacidaminococcus intestinavium]|uniref:DUF1828 domain-containing protein n=1 Tax=Candidatus Avacidaminococcus intestinavium TaxID=2840684 RepID=A0A9D1MPW2_9FIRM|nr:DUF1828 domain-containing protein [Candidatus Avacidaminococcus intestinavium]
MLNKEKLESIIADNFYSRFKLVERKKNFFQLFSPLYHPDGDMLDIFLKISESDDVIKVCDSGMSLMRLSYTYDLDTENKKSILANLLRENEAFFADGNIYMETTVEFLFPTIMKMSQVIAKVCNMKILQRSNITNLFYDQVQEYIVTNLKKYNPQVDQRPIADREELVVDYVFVTRDKPIYLFAVKGIAKAQSAVISILSFQKEGLPFWAVVVNENVDELPKTQRKLLMSAADKQFYDLKDFKKNADDFMARHLN